MSEQASVPATDLITVTIDGREVQAPKGTVLVEAAKQIDVEIPVFCYEPRLGAPIGACRMCLVEVEGMRGLQTACSTVVSPDMVVHTRSPAAVEAQDGVLELLLANHPLDCPVCDKGGECPLQDQTFTFGPGRSRMVEPKRHFPKPLDLSPLVAIDRERCITCYRCIRFSQEVAEDGQLTFQERGSQTEVATFTGEPYLGRFTGNIIDLCPVGALTSVPYRFVSRPWDIQNTPSVCSHCPVGCNTELTLREGEIKRVTGRPDPNMAVEEGWLCDKGRWAYDGAGAHDRLTEPVMRGGTVGERNVTIDRAVGAAAAILMEPGVRAAILVGTKATVEEGFLAQRLVGTLRGAPVSRLGVPGGALTALRALPAADLAAIDAADVIAIVGGDPANQQPVVELRLRRAHRRGARVVCVGPRPHPIEALGTAHRSTPGDLDAAIPALSEALAGATRPVICWDEADLAAEPAAAARLAETAAATGAALLELGHGANGAGLRALGITTSGVLEALEAGRVDVLVTLLATPTGGAGGERWSRASAAAPTVIEVGTHRTAVTDAAAVVLPTLTAYEREGVLVSMTGRAQRLRPGARGPEGAAAAWEILLALDHRIGGAPQERTPAQVFQTLAGAVPAFAGLDYSGLGTEGVLLPARGEAADPTSATAVGEGLPLVVTMPTFGGDARRSAALARVRPQATLGLHPDTAATAGLADGASATVTSPHGSCTLTVATDAALAPGAAYAPVGLGAGTERLLAADHGLVRVTLTGGSV